jgi:hypothetical protein
VNIPTSQQNLIITESGRPVITVDRRKTIEAVKSKFAAELIKRLQAVA